ncbi:MAG TPA: chromosome segregation protein SMC [Candidatus Limnocylindrales bacterium]
MSAPARLLSVRLQGFKSFAERTHVAFGPGISAVVGPNGSGKSNLADALRWALGEQGRALRTRKSEDVIWAGSERRPALGMADVQLVLDNADGLLPVDFGVVEVGRRLYRSGENEYVLNRQRVRLRDLVDLLDAAHLAENAFLFIGQGMVDQALALRPEERRPLFEEVAGVRRHERRRRRAEEQLAESDANLARVEDIAAELRPQVRRLAAQAQQQASRRDAGAELADALLAANHARWHAAAGRLASARQGLAGGRVGLDAALAELAVREDAAANLAERLSASAAATDAARGRLDAARDELAAARLEAARSDAEAAAITREREALVAEQAAMGSRLLDDRRAAATTITSADPALEHDLRTAEAALAEAHRALTDARAATRAEEADREAARRSEAARIADLEQARRRHGELDRELATERNRAAELTSRLEAVDGELARAQAGVAAAVADEARAIEREAAATSALRAAQDDRATAASRHAEAGSQLAGARERQATAAAALEALEAGELAVAATAAGGRRIDSGLEVDASLRAAVAAALGELAAGFVVRAAGVPGLVAERGTLVVQEAIELETEPDPAARAAIDALTAAVAAAGGGPLASAVRRDGTGAVRALLRRAAWLPSLADCLALQARIPAGWLLVSRDGGAVVSDVAVSLGRAPSVIDRRADVERLGHEVEVATAAERAAAADVAASSTAADDAAQDLEAARRERAAAGQARRAAEAAEAATGRQAEAVARESAWLGAQVDRLASAAERAAATLAALEGGVSPGDGSETATPGTAPASDALAALEQRVADLRATRDRTETAWRDAEGRRRDAEREQARAEAGVTLAERRTAEIERALAALELRDDDTASARAAGRLRLEGATSAVAAAESAARTAVEHDAAERVALAGAERAAAVAREALQRLQDGARAVEREELEARLALEALREQLLVELAGLGEVGTRLVGIARPNPAAPAGADADALEAGIAALVARWEATPYDGDIPTPARLASLRRRFHELGAPNPYAVEEHAELAARLEALETQRADLGGAVEKTRALIAELDGLIAGQFRSTFAALEAAFDARFRQLFGGGYAKLSLTEPGDLAATGIEITARPPGKKPQALAMLSGGERALTAVALLFAMLEVRPVPFCVLDEVDAALDEANVGRFTDALRSLAAQTQFIVITHNRGTIETADALYGVTVGDDSVSRVISLRLEEATALAGRATDGAADAVRPVREPIIPAGLADEAASLTPEATG